MPMPQDDDASTQNSISEAGGGLERTQPQKSADNRARHHCMSEITLALGVLRAKGKVMGLNEEAKREIEGR